MLRVGTVVGIWGVACALLYGQGVDVAILQSGEGGFYAEAVQRFHATLEQQGYSLQTLTFVLKGDRSDQDLPRRILEKRPKVILAVGTNAAKALRAYYEKVPPQQQAPVVFLQVLDPVGERLIQSPERSGTRFAGVALTVRPQRQLSALLDVAPEAKRVGVVYNPKDAVSQRLIEQAREDAARMGVALQEASAEQASQIGDALKSLEGKVDALWLIPDPVCAAPEPSQRVLEFAEKHRLPVLAFAGAFVQRGALVATGVDMAEQGALAAEQVMRILEGEPPESLPLLTPRRTLTFYNLKTARRLNLTIPDMLLNLAKTVYEQ
ncbi:MAG: ABC transporter substrate-binding protein [Armatimonadetes bacterium]|nr:ABC transporter substrate-binding protein [Armatimonadota bacterium]